MRYDPEKPPRPDVWRSLDEGEAQLMIARHHRSRACQHPPAPNRRVHDMMHLIVENQAADPDLPIAETLTRLVGEGLTRHEAVHAVASVVSTYLFDALGPEAKPPDTAQYHADVRALTAEAWLRSAAPDSASPTSLESVLAAQHAAMDEWQVRALFLGALASTNTGLVPQHLFPHIFGEEHTFADIEDVQTVLDAVMTLWNELAIAALEDRPMTLSVLDLGRNPSRATLRAYASHREQELRCSLIGFEAGGDDPVEFGLEGAELFRRLTEARSVYEEHSRALPRGRAGDSREQRAETGRMLRELTTSTEHVITEILRVGRTIRGDAIEAYDELSQRTQTDDGVPTGRGKVGRNAACLCGSGRKYKKCCGGGGATVQ